MATLKQHLAGKGRKYKQALARAVGVTESSLNRYCNGHRKPTWDVINKLKQATGGEVTADSFLDDEDEQAAAA